MQVHTEYCIDIHRSYIQCNILPSLIQKKDTSQSFSHAPPPHNNIYAIKTSHKQSNIYYTHRLTEGNCGVHIKEGLQ